MSAILGVENRRFVRPDGRAKVDGSGRYTADLYGPDQLHARFRYADLVYARVVSVDVSRARALPGVAAVLTHRDVPDIRYGVLAKDRRLFAKEKVRWEGEVVAAVAAETAEIAQRAAELVDVEYEPLEPQVDFVAAMDVGAPLVHEDWLNYDAHPGLHRDGNVLAQWTVEKGDADAAMTAAEVVVRNTYRTDPSHGVPIEPRAIVAEWTGEQLTVWSSTQVPFVARSGIAYALQIPESQVRVVVPLLGGGFGSKCDFHFEAHVAALARVAGRPVKLVFSRREEFVAPDHRREGMEIELETGATRDGRLVARRGRLVLDGGAYCGESGQLAQLAAMNACGPYSVENVDVSAYLNYTTTQPSGPIRAPTGPQVCWAVEQHMDELAVALRLDPVELRRRTLVGDGVAGPHGRTIVGVAAREALEGAVEAIGYRRELPADEAIGVACGWWPSFRLASGARIEVDGDGRATIVTGGQECGSGAVMGLPLLAAEVLGMCPDDFALVYQDTSGPWDMGASGSQTTINTGRAVVAAAEDLRRQLLDIVASRVGAESAELELAGGVVRRRGECEPLLTIAEAARETSGLVGTGEVLAPEGDVGSGPIADQAFDSPCVFAHAVRVRVDRETGITEILEVVAAHDSGRILNPVGAAGQVHGGVAMGIGLALTEGVQLDGEGRQRNASLLDYKLPTAVDVPPIEIVWVGAPADDVGPSGSKGLGEAPCVPTAAAIANAIAKVVGVHVDRLPMTAERVWAAARAVSPS